MKNVSVITINEKSITDFAKVRNRELAKVKTEWVLYLDSDEKLSEELKNEIEAAVESDKYDAYYIRRDDTFLGRVQKHGETGGAHFVRLATKSWGRWERPVHEVWLAHRGRKGQDRVGRLKHPMLHMSHTTIASFLGKINRYSQIEAKYRYKQGVRSSLFHITCYPLAKWFYNYVLRFGFLDGIPGLIHACMMSFHSYLTWSKLYLLWHKK